MRRALAFITVAGFLSAVPTFANEQCAPAQHAPLNIQQDMDYLVARTVLIRDGWQARFRSGTAVDPESLWGNEKTLFEMGMTEVESCSGTGIASCLMKFSDAYGNLLDVVTYGEMFELNPYPAVLYFHFNCDPAD